MAEIDIYYSGGVIMDGPSVAPYGSIYIDVGGLLNGNLQVANSTTFSVADPSGVLNTFTGSGFTYNSLYTPTGGTVTGYTSSEGGAVAAKVSGITSAATAWVTWAATDDNTSMFQSILGGPNTINGGVGNDELRGWGTSDVINGGAGDDTLVGGTGRETLFGGLGNDSIVGGAGFNQVNGNQGNDTIVGHSQVGDWLVGGQGNDLIDASASTGANILNGNLGNDTIIGGAGADSLRGGQGDDVIHAGSGNDWISGDLGNNTIYGGQGMDTFHAGAGHDVIYGWHDGDKIEIAGPAVNYSASQVGNNITIVFSNGGEIDIMNAPSFNLSGIDPNNPTALPPGGLPGWLVVT
jgi:Ca2+-binding RTX toxin-like protein